MIEHLPSMQEALDAIPVQTNKQTNKPFFID